MSEIIKKRASESIGKDAKIFLINGWRYAGRVTGCDDVYIEILDRKNNGFKIIRFLDIKDMEVKE